MAKTLELCLQSINKVGTIFESGEFDYCEGQTWNYDKEGHHLGSRYLLSSRDVTISRNNELVSIKIA